MKANDAVRWIARNIIGNEVRGFEPLPLSLRDDIARAMVDDKLLGWPSIEEAEWFLDAFEWRADITSGATS